MTFVKRRQRVVGRGLVVSEHGVEDVGAAAGEGDECRVVLLLDLFGDLGALLAQRRELRGQSWQQMPAAFVPVTTTVCAASAAKISSVSRPPSRGAPLEQPGPHLGLPGCGESGWGGPGLEQVQHGRVIQPWSQDAFQRGVDLGEQPTDPVAGRGDLPG